MEPVPRSESTEDVLAGLKACAWFEDLPEPALAQLARAASVRECAPGVDLFVRHDRGDEFYVVQEGRVALTVPTEATSGEATRGTPRPLGVLRVRTAGPGEVLGEVACLEDGGRRTATATTETACRLIVLRREVLPELVASHPTAALGMIRQLASRLEWHTDRWQRLLRSEEEGEVEELDPRSAGERFADGAAAGAGSLFFVGLNLVPWIVFLGVRLGGTASRWVEGGWPPLLALGQVVLLLTLLLLGQRRLREQRDLRADRRDRWAAVTVERTKALLLQMKEIESRLARAEWRPRREARPSDSEPPRR